MAPNLKPSQMSLEERLAAIDTKLDQIVAICDSIGEVQAEIMQVQDAIFERLGEVDQEFGDGFGIEN